MPQSRDQLLARMAECLNTPDGQILMAELETMWDGYGLMGVDGIETGWKIGQRDAFKYLKQLSDGDTI